MQLKKKISKASKELAKLNSAWDPTEPNEDREMITSEERECLRKIALKMDSTLVLGKLGYGSKRVRDETDRFLYEPKQVGLNDKHLFVHFFIIIKHYLLLHFYYKLFHLTRLK